MMPPTVTALRLACDRAAQSSSATGQRRRRGGGKRAADVRQRLVARRRGAEEDAPAVRARSRRWRRRRSRAGPPAGGRPPVRSGRQTDQRRPGAVRGRRTRAGAAYPKMSLTRSKMPRSSSVCAASARGSRPAASPPAARAASSAPWSASSVSAPCTDTCRSPLPRPAHVGHAMALQAERRAGLRALGNRHRLRAVERRHLRSRRRAPAS